MVSYKKKRVYEYFPVLNHPFTRTFVAGADNYFGSQAWRSLCCVFLVLHIVLWFIFLLAICIDIVFLSHRFFAKATGYMFFFAKIKNKTWDKFKTNSSSLPGREISRTNGWCRVHMEIFRYLVNGGSHVNFLPNVQTLWSSSRSLWIFERQVNNEK